MAQASDEKATEAYAEDRVEGIADTVRYWHRTPVSIDRASSAGNNAGDMADIAEAMAAASLVSLATLRHHPPLPVLLMTVT